MRRITLVKKVLADGRPCRKCHEIGQRLEQNGHAAWIDRVVVADEREPHGEGWALACAHGVTVAPFFVVEEAGTTRVYTVYLKFVREVLGDAATRPTAALPGRDATAGG